MVRKLYLLLVLTSFSLSARRLPVLSTTSLSNPAQRFEHVRYGNYAQDDNNLRNLYVGTWQYNQGGILFVIKLTKRDQVLNKREFNGEIQYYDYADEIDVRYKLVKNGMVLFDNLNSTDVSPIKSYGIAMVGYDLDGRILDQTRNVIGDFTAKRLMISGPPKILFDLNRFDYTMLNPSTYYQDGQPLFSIPTGEIEMIKID